MLSGNISFGTISNNMLEINIQKGNFLKLPLENFLEILNSYIM